MNSLTPRQRAVVGELMHGRSNKMIAYALGMSEATVKVHLRKVMKRFGFTNRVQIVLRLGSEYPPTPRPSPPRDVGCW